MDPITASAAITAGASIVNGMMGGASASREYSYARRLQKHDQAFQKEMRATAYQTTVEDMQKAGINPAVALSNGASASQAQGGSSQSAPNVNYGGIDIPGMMQAMQATALTEAQKENIEADTAVKEEQSGKNKAETELIKSQKKINEAISKAEIALKSAQTKAEKANIAMTLTQQAKDTYYTLYISKYGHAPDAKLIDRVGGKIEKIISNATINEDIKLDGAKLNSMINEWLKD